MSEASKDPKRESLKKRAELLKQELSAAITSRDVTSAVGILKKLQGMPSEFVPSDLSSLAEQLKSEISSNSALGSESAAEAARKAKEEEERIQSRILYSIEQVRNYLDRDDVKVSTKLHEEMLSALNSGQKISVEQARKHAELRKSQGPERKKVINTITSGITEILENMRRFAYEHVSVENQESKKKSLFDLNCLAVKLARNEEVSIQLMSDPNVQAGLRSAGMDDENERRESKELLAKLNLAIKESESVIISDHGTKVVRMLCSSYPTQDLEVKVPSVTPKYRNLKRNSGLSI